ncbi:MAG: hypothetical protein ACPGPF_04485 [Pontibacterium sp.]
MVSQWTCLLRGCFFALSLCISFFATSAYAHNVIGGVYAIGELIEGEVGFSNGDMAKAGSEIIVSDSAGNELGRAYTDADGLFAYTATARIDHHFYANLSSGHVLQTSLPAEELPDTLPGDGVVNGNAGKKAPNLINAEAISGDQVALALMIEKAVAKQVKPLRQELAAYKEKTGLRDIIGGIGYIFGLCGVAIWWREREKAKQQALIQEQAQKTSQDKGDAPVS